MLLQGSPTSHCGPGATAFVGFEDHTGWGLIPRAALCLGRSTPAMDAGVLWPPTAPAAGSASVCPTKALAPVIVEILAGGEAAVV